MSVFAILPHMHQMGRHLTFWHTPAGGDEQVVFDRDYDFDAQHLEMYDPFVELAPGDTIRVECTWDNATNETVTFGESSNDEMCFAGLWSFPSHQALCE